MSPQIATLIVPPATWPADDRERWARAVAGNGYKGPDNPAAKWSPSRREIVADSYGRFLGWLEKSKGKISDGSCAHHVNPKNVAAYVTHLREKLTPWSATIYIGGLLRFVAVTAPKMELDWLQDRYRKMKARAESTRPKTAHLQHTGELVKYGLALMRQATGAKVSKRSRGIRAAQKGQAGLMIAMLAVAPLRIRNFQDIEIGKSLVYESGRYIVRFTAEETKTGVESENLLPPEFEPYLEAFFSKHRPTLIKQGAGKQLSAYLWIDRSGKKMSETTLRDTIKRWTKLKFGKHVWPHLFRDAAATSIAQDAPEHVGVVTSVLSHTSIATAKKHYDQSTALQANRVVASVIAGLRAANDDPDETQ
jgi:integrase/recombinase XerD